MKDMEREHDKISVIIPVYNVAEYIKRCLDSVIGQTYEHLEIIIVDDGSTDNSGRICDTYGSMDSRIIVIHQENMGLAGAKNTGLKHASGTYISFVDSDDYIEQTAYMQLINYVKAKDCDACFFGHYRENGTHRVSYGKRPEKLIYTGPDEILSMFFSDTLYGNPNCGNCFTGLSSCCVLYKATLLKKNDLVFKSERDLLSEDILFNLEVCALSNQIVVYPEYLYHYVNRGNSLTRKYRLDRFEAALRMDEEMIASANHYNIYSYIKKGIDHNYAMNLIVCLKQELYFEQSNGYSNVIRKIKDIGTNKRTRKFLKDNLYDGGAARIILYCSLKLRAWHLVHLLIKLQIKKITKKGVEKTRIKTIREQIIKYALLFQVLFMLFALFLTTVCGMPDSVIHVLDIVTIVLFLLSIPEMIHIKEKNTRIIVLFILIFLGYTVVDFFMNGQSIFFYAWGLRNTFRFFAYFVICILEMRLLNISLIMKAFELFVYLNVFVCSWQFWIQHQPFDNICGLFGVGTKGSGYMNVLLVIVTAFIAVQFLQKRIPIWHFILALGSGVYISIISELKVYYFELAVIIIIALFLNIKSKIKLNKNIIIAIVTCVIGMVLIATITVALNPEYWKGFFLPKGAWEQLTRKSGYSASGDLNRLTAIPDIFTNIFNRGAKSITGFGLGNCDYSNIKIFKTPFYNTYQGLNYVWIHIAFLFLELGFVGILFYIGFLSLVGKTALNNQVKGFKIKEDELLNQVAFIVSICSVLFLFYNVCLRIEAAYMIFFVLALPYYYSNGKVEKE